jgi:2,3-dihydroxybenzoate-AMP ligase
VVDVEGNRLSYAELAAEAARLAAGLHRLGIRRTDRVVVQLPNITEFLTLCFALFRIGALPVMALPPHREHEISYLVEHSEAVAYAVPDRFRGFDFLELAATIRAGAPSLEHVLVAGDAEGDGAVALADLAVDDEDALAAVDADGPSSADVALFLLSGGTTALPKLIPRTHDDYVYNFRASAAVCGFSDDTVYLACLPVSHNFPLGAPGLLAALDAGGRVALSPDPGPATAFMMIERERVNVTSVVPAVAIRWMDSPLVAQADLSSLVLLQVGGARLQPEAARRVGPVLDCRLQQVFGMAEGLLNYTRAGDPDDVIVETQGRPCSEHDELRIVDEDGYEVAEGEAGELLTRGPYTIRGYYRADEHNARAFTPDGFYRTGDRVRMHPSGNLVVDGREKDLINRGGEKISAEEIENLMLAHPKVLEVAAVAMPDPALGERTCAYAVLRPGERLDLDELLAFLAQKKLARFKLPERLECVAALPLTNVGKVDKKNLREDIARKLEAE